MGCKGSGVRISPPRPVVTKTCSRNVASLFYFTANTAYRINTSCRSQLAGDSTLFCFARKLAPTHGMPETIVFQQPASLWQSIRLRNNELNFLRPLLPDTSRHRPNG